MEMRNRNWKEWTGNRKTASEEAGRGQDPRKQEGLKGQHPRKQEAVQLQMKQETGRRPLERKQ